MLPLAQSADEVLRRIVGEVTGTQAAPAEATVLLTAVAALFVVLLRRPWRIARHAVTMAHEGAHAVAAILTGRRLRGVTLHADASGAARSAGRSGGPGLALVAAAGYPGPALLGLGAAALLAAGHALAVLWLGVVLAALMLLQIRNLWGVLVVVSCGAAAFAVSWWAAGPLQSAFAYAITWFLLLAAPRTVVELQRARRYGGAQNSDADVLARITHVPAIAWVGLFLAAALGCLVLGGSWLLA